MYVLNSRHFAILSIGLALCDTGSAAIGQDTSTRAPAVAAQSGDSARRSEILNSECWRRVMFEYNEWLRTQQVFPPDEAARIRSDLQARIDQTSVDDLESLLTDLQAKFRILKTPQAQDVRAWFGQYLSILADRPRDELIGKIPDVATMSSAQLQKTIDRLALRRDSRARKNRDVQQLRKSASNPWAQSSPAASRPRQSGAYRSPYRPRSTERPFENHQTGSGNRWTIDPNGGMWRSITF